MKQILLTALLSAVSLGAWAETESFAFSYCSPTNEIKLSNLSALGSSAVQKYGAAIGLNAPYYKGVKLKKIDAYINADAATLRNMSDFQIFLSGELTEQPDIMVQDVTPTPTTLAGDNLAVMSYTFSEPYELDGSPLYVGYYLNVNNVAGEGEKHPILIDKAETTNPNALFYYDPAAMREEPTNWNTYGYVEGAAIIYLTLERETAEYSLGLGIPEKVYAEAGVDYEVLLPVVNLGSNPISELSYAYSVDGSQPIEFTDQLDYALMPSPTAVYYILLPLDKVNETGEFTVEFTVDEVNGQPNESVASSTTFDLEVWPFIPQHRPLVEEFTSVQCGWCPRGFVAMEYISEEYPDDAVVICYHDNQMGYDPMVVTNTMPISFNGLPNASIDRIGTLDPYYGSSSNTDLGIIDNLAAQAIMLAIADIKISSVSVDDGVINVKTDVTFLKDVNDDQYRIGYVLTCNGMTSTDLSWGQDNYFSRFVSGNQFKDTPLLGDFYNANDKVYGLVYNDVAIETSAMAGVKNSIGKPQVATPVTHEYSFDVSNLTNYYKESLYPYAAIERMVVNAYIIDRQTNTIVNACKFAVGNVYDSVAEIGAEETVSTIYYDLAGRRVNNPDKGIFIKSETLSNGAVRTSKIVK